MLCMSVAAVNSALQRARVDLARSAVEPDALGEPEGDQQEVVERYMGDDLASRGPAEADGGVVHDPAESDGRRDR